MVGSQFFPLLGNQTALNGVEHYFSIQELVKVNPFVPERCAQIVVYNNDGSLADSPKAQTISRDAIVIGEDAGNNLHYLYFRGPKTGQLYFYDADFPPDEKTEKPVAQNLLDFLEQTYCADSAALFFYGVRMSRKKEAEQAAYQPAGAPAPAAPGAPPPANAQPAGDGDVPDAAPEDEDGESQDEPDENEPIGPNENTQSPEGIVPQEEESQVRKGAAHLRYYGYVTSHGYVRVRDYVMADVVMSAIMGRPIGPIFRHANKLMYDYGVDTHTTRKKEAKVTYLLVPKAIGSVVHGGMPRVSGIYTFVELVQSGKVVSDLRHYIA